MPHGLTITSYCPVQAAGSKKLRKSSLTGTESGKSGYGLSWGAAAATGPAAIAMPASDHRTSAHRTAAADLTGRRSRVVCGHMLVGTQTETTTSAARDEASLGEWLHEGP